MSNNFAVGSDRVYGNAGDWSITSYSDEENDNTIVASAKMARDYFEVSPLHFKEYAHLETIRKINKNLKNVALFWLEENHHFLMRATVVNLSNKGLTCFPELFRLWISNVKELNLSHNNLRSLPKSLCLLQQLVKIDISNNPLLRLEPTFFDKFTDKETFTILISPDQTRMAEEFTDLPRYCEFFLV